MLCALQVTMGIRSAQTVLVTLLGMCAHLGAASKHPAKPPPATLALEHPRENTAVTAGSEEPEGREYIAIDGFAYFEGKHTFQCAASHCLWLPGGPNACSAAVLLPLAQLDCHISACI